MIFNCQDKIKGKGFYLERAAERLGIEIKEDGYVLNIEPYEFKKGDIWTGIWEIDLLLDRHEMTTENWSQADTIFTAISTIPPRFKNFRTELLFQASDPQIHIKNPKYEYDIVFCGSKENPCYKERERIYNLIKEKFSFKDYGKNHSLQGYVDACNTARIQFIRSMKTDLAEGELAQRFWEGLAIGSVLTNYVPDLELTGLVEGKDYLSYRNDSDMLEKIDWMLKNPRVINCENPPTYDDRLKTIRKFAGIP